MSRLEGSRLDHLLVGPGFLGLAGQSCQLIRSETSRTPYIQWHPEMRDWCAKQLSWPWTQVIAKNMRSGGAIEPMIPGERVHAIFGFCDIRNFTDTTEVLQVGQESRHRKTWK